MTPLGARRPSKTCARLRGKRLEADEDAETKIVEVLAARRAGIEEDVRAGAITPARLIPPNRILPQADGRRHRRYLPTDAA